MSEKETRKKEARRSGTLTIKGIQRGYGQEDTSEITTTADYFHKDGKRYLFYREYMEGGAYQQVRLTVDGNEVTLKKSGMGLSVLRFQKGKLLPCHYQSPAGPMEMVSKTRSIRLRESEHSLLLKMDYSLSMFEQLISDYQLEIRWEENPGLSHESGL